MHLHNLMPHALRVHDDGGAVTYVLEPYVAADDETRYVARLDTTQTLLGSMTVTDDAPPLRVYTPQIVTRLSGLPPFDASEQALVPIVVSGMVGEYIAAHCDVWRGPVFSPDSSPAGAIRSADGQVYSVRGLVQHKA